MQSRVVVISGQLSGQTCPLGDGLEFTIGREPSNSLCAPDLAVSRRHCAISGGPERFVLRDLDSRNGTFVNGLPVREHLLRHGDRIKAGETVLVFLEAELEAPPVAPPVAEEDAVLTRTSVRLRPDDAELLQPAREDRLARDLSALLHISTAVSSVTNLEALQRQLIESVFRVVPAQRGAILLAGDDESLFTLRRSPGQEEPVPISRTVVRQVLDEGDAFLCNEVLKSPVFEASKSLVSAGSRSLVAAPIALSQKVLGVIYIDTTDPEVRFDEAHLQLLTAVGSIAAGALANALQVDRLENENRRLREEIDLKHDLIGDSRRMHEVLQFIAKVAPKDTTVLIRGESGTGKELMARAIHRNSLRASGPFMGVNCAALAETLLESELFGHEKGAFTGAIAQKRGRLEVADRGTLFLDEVGDLPPAVQIKLLRVLQEREFERVGGTRPIKVDIRLVAATNRDLEEAIKTGAFRRDLYFRLNVVSLTMPALREHREDIPLLANYFISKLSQKAGRGVIGLSADARACLLRHDWPGNVRELENAVEHAVVLGSSELILPEDLPQALLEEGTPEGLSLGRYHAAVLETKKRLILDAIEQAAGNLTAAAKLLGLHPNYLHRLIRNMNLRADVRKDAAAGSGSRLT